METLKTAQDLIKTENGNIRSGFNQFIYGNKKPLFSDYGDKSQWGQELQGYEFAEKMAMEKGIAFVNVFTCGKSGCFPFMYGGSFVCNSCGMSGVDKDWWKIKVLKDGNQFICHGLDFINLQESHNFAFGSTFEESISNYGNAMLSAS